MNDKCYKFPDYKICYENYFMNAGLILSKITDDGNINSLDFKPSAGDFLSRLIGSPPAALYKIIEFSANKVGLQHARRFTLLKDGAFCQSIETNPNHRLSFGVLSKDSKIFLFSSGTGTSIDRPVDGWRVFDENRLCK